MATKSELWGGAGVDGSAFFFICTDEVEMGSAVIWPPLDRQASPTTPMHPKASRPKSLGGMAPGTRSFWISLD